MDYLRGSFSVSAPGTKTYRDNFDKIDWGHDRKSVAKDDADGILAPGTRRHAKASRTQRAAPRAKRSSSRR